MADGSDDPLAEAVRWIAEGRGVALATVTRTWGSAPRPAGSLMAVRDDGAFAGSVSGGCVETAVIGEAQSALGDAQPRRLSYGVSNEDAWAVGLACGGTIEVAVAPLRDGTERALIQALQRARTGQRAVVLATQPESGVSRLVEPGDGGALGDAARLALQRDQSGPADIEGASWFLNVFNPPVDLAIIGAVHIAQPLAAMAALAGHAVRIVDPRTRFASAERFPGVRLQTDWPEDALAAAPLTARSAVVALTHDPKLDDPALAAALRSPAFYIGALGSRQTHARRLDRLAAEGFSPADLTRIRGPIGLAIGARSPAEIAIAILAEITRVLRGAEETGAKKQPGALL